MTRIVRWSALALIGAAAVSACGGDGSSGSASSPTAAVETTAAVTVADTIEAPTTDSPTSIDAPATLASTPTVEAAATTVASEPVNGDCLVGDWVVTEDEMNSFYSGLMATLDAPLLIEATGSAPLSFRADGTYGWAPDFVLTVEVAGQRGEGVTGGTITGNWAVADGVITTASEVNALEVAVTVGGATVSGDDLTNGLLDASPVNGVTYSCDGPSPVLDFKTADPDVTVPITLSRA